MFAALCQRAHTLKHSLAESIFVSRVQKTAKKIFVSRKVRQQGHSLAEVSLYYDRTSFTLRDAFNTTNTYIMTQHEFIRQKSNKKTNLNNRKQTSPPPSPTPTPDHRCAPNHSLGRRSVMPERTEVQTKFQIPKPNQIQYQYCTYLGRLRSSKGETEAAVPSRLVNQSRRQHNTVTNPDPQTQNESSVSSLPPSWS